MESEILIYLDEQWPQEKPIVGVGALIVRQKPDAQIIEAARAESSPRGERFHATNDNWLTKRAFARAVGTHLGSAVLIIHRWHIEERREAKNWHILVRGILETIRMAFLPADAPIRIHYDLPKETASLPLRIERTSELLLQDFATDPTRVTRFPKVQFKHVLAADPGMQIVDLLLWAACRSDDSARNLIDAAGFELASSVVQDVVRDKSVVGRDVQGEPERGALNLCAYIRGDRLFGDWPTRPRTVSLERVSREECLALLDWVLLNVERMATQRLPLHAEHHQQRARDALDIFYGRLDRRNSSGYSEIFWAFLLGVDTVPLYNSDEAEWASKAVMLAASHSTWFRRLGTLSARRLARLSASAQTLLTTVTTACLPASSPQRQCDMTW